MKYTIYILGAGCSAFKDGYPLARDFRDALNAFRERHNGHVSQLNNIGIAATRLSRAIPLETFFSHDFGR